MLLFFFSCSCVCGFQLSIVRTFRKARLMPFELPTSSWSGSVRTRAVLLLLPILRFVSCSLRVGLRLLFSHGRRKAPRSVSRWQLALTGQKKAFYRNPHPSRPCRLSQNHHVRPEPRYPRIGPAFGRILPQRMLGARVVWRQRQVRLLQLAAQRLRRLVRIRAHSFTAPVLSNPSAAGIFSLATDRQRPFPSAGPHPL